MSNISTMPNKIKPIVQEFFDEPTNTYSYVVSCPNTQSAAIIDSVLDLDYASGRTKTVGADAIIAYVKEQNLSVKWILETHVHADHLSAAPYLKKQLGGETAIGQYITQVQATFAKVFNVEAEFVCDGHQFDHLFSDGEYFSIGDLTAQVIHTPGHTPACLSFLIADAVFVGDTLFMPDYGTARCDFPGGDANTLYQSVQKLMQLPDETRMFLCHDYLPAGRTHYQCKTTVGEQRLQNVHIHQGVTQEQFVAMREKRDASLAMPRLIIPSVQVNMRAGEMPPAESNQQVYLKVPINVL